MTAAGDKLRAVRRRLEALGRSRWQLHYDGDGKGFVATDNGADESLRILDAAGTCSPAELEFAACAPADMDFLLDLLAQSFEKVRELKGGATGGRHEH